MPTTRKHSLSIRFVQRETGVHKHPVIGPLLQILGSDAQQTDVFQHVSHVVDSVMAGFNGTVLAYGQTSAGNWVFNVSS
jgi:hypothetical protein